MNTLLQGTYLGELAGGVFKHKSVLYNSVAYVLFVDALQHERPGSFNRVSDSYQDTIALGLSLTNVIETESQNSTGYFEYSFHTFLDCLASLVSGTTRTFKRAAQASMDGREEEDNETCLSGYLGDPEFLSVWIISIS